MPQSALYLKVEVEHDRHETPEQLAEEMCRRLLKMHGVRSAQLSAFVTQPQEGEAEGSPPSSSA